MVIARARKLVNVWWEKETKESKTKQREEGGWGGWGGGKCTVLKFDPQALRTGNDNFRTSFSYMQRSLLNPKPAEEGRVTWRGKSPLDSVQLDSQKFDFDWFWFFPHLMRNLKSATAAKPKRAQYYNRPLARVCGKKRFDVSPEYASTEYKNPVYGVYTGSASLVVLNVGIIRYFFVFHWTVAVPILPAFFKPRSFSLVGALT